MKRVTVPLSSARARLFELADLVRTSADGTAVILQQRGHAEGVALVREARLTYLEDRVKQMEQQDTPFTLAGSLRSPLDPDALDQVLKDIRKGWTAPPKAAPVKRAARARTRRR